MSVESVVLLRNRSVLGSPNTFRPFEYIADKGGVGGWPVEDEGRGCCEGEASFFEVFGVLLEESMSMGVVELGESSLCSMFSTGESAAEISGAGVLLEG